MSAATPSGDPDTDRFQSAETTARKRAAIALAVLAGAAVVLVAIMIAVLGSSEKPTITTGAQPKGPDVIVTGGASSTPRTQAHSQRPSKRPARHHNTRHRAVSCPTAAPCAVGTDVGKVVAAINRYRIAHGRPAVTGSVTRAAQICALQSGDLASCHGGYYWEPVARSGQEVVDKIVAGGGVSWLLDTNMTRLAVGWAYLPASKSFYCAVISNA
jgi:hypothetical protein